ncbi:MAG: hypothetical protein ACP5OO_12670 [Chloroflexia bacterium]
MNVRFLANVISARVATQRGGGVALRGNGTATLVNNSEFISRWSRMDAPFP